MTTTIRIPSHFNKLEKEAEYIRHGENATNNKMNKILISILIALSGCVTAMAIEPDLLITQEGESLKVYNLDVSPSTFVYYTLSEDPDAPLHKIQKNSLLIIKRANGTLIDPALSDENKSAEKVSGEKTVENKTHSFKIFHSIENQFIEMEFNPFQSMGNYIGMKKRFLSYHPEMSDGQQSAKFILASDEEGRILNFRLISEKERTLAVACPRLMKEANGLDPKKLKYEYQEYSIPDYVTIGDVRYSVVEIDPRAFLGKKKLNNVIFPKTLRIIGPRAFENCRLKRIILPESVEIVGEMAFYYNLTDGFEELFIPKGVKNIGRNCFNYVGLHNSPRGFTEAYLSSAPDFITTENCTQFGIDDNAVESYERRQPK